jgi:hypothetical protein
MNNCALFFAFGNKQHLIDLQVLHAHTLWHCIVMCDTVLTLQAVESVPHGCWPMLTPNASHSCVKFIQ